MNTLNFTLMQHEFIYKKKLVPFSLYSMRVLNKNKRIDVKKTATREKKKKKNNGHIRMNYAHSSTT